METTYLNENDIKKLQKKLMTLRELDGKKLQRNRLVNLSNQIRLIIIKAQRRTKTINN